MTLLGSQPCLMVGCRNGDIYKCNRAARFQPKSLSRANLGLCMGKSEFESGYPNT